jgi:hypothetical protein
LSFNSQLARAAQWLVQSGIQEPSGGVARYYQTGLARNHRVSTEITGYAVSAFLFLERPAEAVAAARFLTRQAWTGDAMPFEIEPPRFSYFFDCGIIARGLLALWRATGDPEYLHVAAGLGDAMQTDFASTDGTYHPVLNLPSKEPAPHDPSRWSQCPGCYQLKSAMAWYELAAATGEEQFREAYESLLDYALRDSHTFLPGHTDPLKVVDRLHAFLYFLEGLLPAAGERFGSGDACRLALCEGICRVACHLDQTACGFERSDVYAQLLRIRIFADWLGIVPIDQAAAAHEASALAGFQALSPASDGEPGVPVPHDASHVSASYSRAPRSPASHFGAPRYSNHASDPRIEGGFYFGRQANVWLPYVNPVSTAFAVQALALWDQYRARPSGPAASTAWHQLI